jgi:hypothetical protein
MLNSGEKKKNILILVLSEKKFLNETKNHNPSPLQVKWPVPNYWAILATLQGRLARMAE